MGSLHVSLAALLLLATSASAATYPVGPARSYRSPCALAAAVALAPGDVIEVDAGTYSDVCQLKASGTAAAPIVLRGAAGPRPVFDASGHDLSGAGAVPRAIFQWTGGSYWQVEHLELKNAKGSSGNGAGFRLTAGSHDVVLHDLSIHDCQDGGMSDGPATLVISDSDIFANGAGDGYTHNLYLTGESVRLQGNHIHDSAGGQNVKLRVRSVALLYNLIENAGNYEVDLIQGPLTSNANANAVLIGNVVVRSASSGNNSQVILFGSDSSSEAGRNGSLYAVNNTFILRNGANRLLHLNNPAAGSRLYLDNNIIHATVPGTAVAADAATAAQISGSRNFLTSGISAPAGLTETITGTAPGLVSATDAHLLPGAAVIDQGRPAPQARDGSGALIDATPRAQLLSPLGTGPRPLVGALDIGAYEFGAAQPGDGGEADGGVAGDGGAAQGGDGGASAGAGGCQAAGGGRPGPAALALVAVAAVAAVRRRRAS